MKRKLYKSKTNTINKPIKVVNTQTIVFQLNHSHGFYSQLFFLLQTYIYSKTNNYSFYIDSSNWCYTFNKGWNDYFKTSFDYIKNIFCFFCFCN